MIREYPKEIQALMDIFEPYMVHCELHNAPQEAIDAYEKVRKWVWDQGQ